MMIAGLVGLGIAFLALVLGLCVRNWNSAGPRERGFLRRMYLVLPVAGIGFGLLLWLAEQTLPVRSISPAVLVTLLSPFSFWMPAILISRRLTQIRKDEEASGNH